MSGTTSETVYIASRRRRRPVPQRGLDLEAMGFEGINDFKKQNKVKIKETINEENIKMDKDIIYGNYDYTLNIMKIHETISEKFNEINKDEISNLEDEISNFENLIDQSNSINEIVYYTKEIQKLKQKIDSLTQNKIFKTYEDLTKPLLEQFSVLNKTLQQNPDSIAKNIYTTLETVVDTYLSTVGNDLINIKLQKKIKPSKQECSTCGADLSQVDDNDDGMRICPVCATSQQVIIRMYKNDINSNFVPNKNDKDNEKNYRRAILKFDMRGRTDHLPQEEEIIKKLDEYFELKNPDCHQNSVLQRKFVRWQRKGTSIESMLKAFKHCGFKFYEDINYICKIYWGWKQPGIDHLEDKLIEDYRASREAYNKYKGSRGSALLANFELCKNLQRLKFNVKESDFKMVSTEKLVNEYNNIWKKMVYEMGWDKNKD